MADKDNPFAWEENFPPVYGHTSVSFLKNCPGYKDAKSGDMQAALFVVNACVKPNRILELRKTYPDAVLLPVITDNMLPVALAQKIGLNIYTEVQELRTGNRKTFSAMERLLHKPDFSGNILNGQRFIIVDDIVTQGGTISALRKFIIYCGGNVVAVAALAYAAGSQILAPEYHDIYDLSNKFNIEKISVALYEYGIANDFWELTRPQIKYLLRFKELENMIRKIKHVKQCSQNKMDAASAIKPSQMSHMVGK